jgi:hypothetical protein
MYPSGRIQKKINTYAGVCKVLGILTDKEVKVITEKNRLKREC